MQWCVGFCEHGVYMGGAFCWKQASSGSWGIWLGSLPTIATIAKKLELNALEAELSHRQLVNRRAQEQSRA